MKHIYLNLKRFDVPKDLGGVNVLAPVADWAETIINGSEEWLRKYDAAETDFAMFFPEAHLIGAVGAQSSDSPIKVGSQSVYRGDTSIGGNINTEVNFSNSISFGEPLVDTITENISNYTNQNLNTSTILLFNVINNSNLDGIEAPLDNSTKFIALKVLLNRRFAGSVYHSQH